MRLRLIANKPGQISFELSMQTGQNILNSDCKLVGVDIKNTGSRTSVNIMYNDKKVNLTLDSGMTKSLDAQLSKLN